MKYRIENNQASVSIHDVSRLTAENVLVIILNGEHRGMVPYMTMGSPKEYKIFLSREGEAAPEQIQNFTCLAVPGELIPSGWILSHVTVKDDLWLIWTDTVALEFQDFEEETG